MLVKMIRLIIVIIVLTLIYPKNSSSKYLLVEVENRESSAIRMPQCIPGSPGCSDYKSQGFETLLPTSREGKSRIGKQRFKTNLT